MLEAAIYKLRFSEEDLERQSRLWRSISEYLQRYIRADGTTVDLGAGFCHFINNIRSRQKWAVDVNGEILRRHAAQGVCCLSTNAADLSAIPSESVDTVFASNLYEHFDTREHVAQSFQEVHRILRPDGRFLILQPNFAYCYRAYFDFFDHQLSFTHRGMMEGLAICNFKMEKVIPRFLPYTTKSRLPQSRWLVWLYVRFPPAWRLLGAQMLLVAKKS